MVEVSKAITPDMEGDAIGGNVNFITSRAPDEQIFTVNIAAGDSEKAQGGSQSFNVLYGDRSADGRFGYLVNATAWERDWATDNYEPRRAIVLVAKACTREQLALRNARCSHMTSGSRALIRRHRTR